MKRQRFNHHPDNCACPGCMSDQPDFSADAHGGKASGNPDDGTTITNGSGGIQQKFKPFLSLKEIVEQLQTQWEPGEDGFIWEGHKFTWGTDPINYWIPMLGASAPDDFGFGESAGFNAEMMTVHKHSMATNAFEEWDSLIARNLNQVLEPALDADMISFAYSGTTEDNGTYNRYLRFGPSGSDSNHEIRQTAIWLSDDWWSLTEAPLVYGSRGYYTYLHEIGHALGLSHPSSYDAHHGVAVTYAEHAEYAQDTIQYTVMSYFGVWTDGDGDGTWTFAFGGEGPGYYPSTPMLHDVMAIQAKYGIDTWTRSTDTVYGFGSTAGNAVFDFSENRMPILTIVDAGGYDTLDCSAFNHRQTINLEPGSYSSIGRLVDNVAIAYGTSIDKAIGGTRDDTIYGNSADNWLEGRGGRDYLDGKAGADTMVGGGGSDTYVVDNTRDVITEEAEGGIDTVISLLPTYELRSNIENATVGLTTGGTLYGTNGWGNVLTGNAGADALYGRTGNDMLDGGPGGDRLTGGEGKDIFVLRFGEANGDTIVDFEGRGPTSGDIIRFEGYVAGSYVTQSGTNCAVRTPDGIALDWFTLLPPSSGLSSPLHTSDYYFV